MLGIRLVGTFLSAPVNVRAGVTDLLVGGTAAAPVLYAASRAGGGVMAIAVEPGAMTLLGWQGLAPGATLSAPSQLTLLDVGGSPALIVTGPDGSRLGGWRLADGGGFGAAVAVPGSPARPVSAIASTEIGGQRLVYIVNQDGQGALRTGLLHDDGRMTLRDAQSIASTDPGAQIADLHVVAPGGRPMLVAVSREESRLITFGLDGDGVPERLSALGAAGGLGIAGPTEMVSATVGGTTYLIVAGGISSSLSVIRLWNTGEMLLTDHVIDTRDTRFQGAGAVATISIGGQTVVVTGGGDAGITLFLLAPGGRLVLAGRLVDPGRTAIDNLQALALRHEGDVLEIFAAGEGAGVTRLQVDVAGMTAPRVGTSGADSLTGGAGIDLLAGDDGADTLVGLAGIDVLIDGAGSDSLFGGTGADTFVLMPDGAVDVIRDFQVGVDRLDLSNWGRVFSLDAVRVSERPTGQLMLVWGNEILFIASSNGATMRARDVAGAGAFDTWHLLAPRPVIDRVYRGTPGDDALAGGAGDDTLIGGAGADRKEGGPGTDIADYTASPQGVAVDLLTGRGLGGDAGGDVLTGIEAVIGSGYADRLTGSVQDNVLRGAAGADVLRGGAGNDLLDGAAGDDRLYGEAGADTLSGGGGNDVLSGGAGRDVIDGGTGIDLVSYARALSFVRVDLLGADPSGGAAFGDSIRRVEALEGTPFDDVLSGSHGNNTITGLAGDDRILGRLGRDVIRGDAGNDLLSGGGWIDRLYGGNGRDTLAGDGAGDLLFGGAGFDIASYVSAGRASVSVNLGAPQRNAGAAQADRLTGIEGVIGAGAGDRLTGNAVGNRLDGRAGDDTLVGGAGNDRLLGGAGRDRLSGGTGSDWLLPGPDRVADRLFGGTGTDFADYGGARGLTVHLMQQWRNAGAAFGDRLFGIEGLGGSRAADRITGNDAGNRIWGSLGNDLLVGGRGGDRLDGGGGGDMLRGGAGDDRLYGGRRADRLSGGDGRDRLDGGADGDRLAGDRGDDRLYGGGGRDRLDGGAGNDLLTGGAGADRFVFWSGRDRITDAARAEGDRLLVERDLFARELTETQIIDRHVRIADGDLIFLGRGGARLVVEDVGTKRGLADWLDLI
jgi:Ca2+-binding RTX toxin-like protein